MGPGQPGGNAQWGGPAGMPPQGFAGRLEFGSAHSSAVKAFGKGWLPLCGLGLIALVVLGGVVMAALVPIISEMSDAVQSGADPDTVSADFEGSMGLMVPSFIASAVIALCQAAAITTGRHIHETGSGGLNFNQFGNVLLISIVVGLVNTAFGSIPILGFIFSLAISFLTFFAASAAAHGVKLVDALKESYKMATANIGGVVILMILAIGYALAAVITCGLGTIALLPLYSVLGVTAYRQVKGLPIAQ